LLGDPPPPRARTRSRRPDKREYFFSSNHNCICMMSEVGAVQCLPFSGFVNLVCRHLVGLSREIGSLQGLYEHSARQTQKCRAHPLPKRDCHPRSQCSEGTYKPAVHAFHRAAPVVSRINPAIVKLLDLCPQGTADILDLPRTQFIFEFLYACIRKEPSTYFVVEEKD